MTLVNMVELKFSWVVVSFVRRGCLQNLRSTNILSGRSRVPGGGGGWGGGGVK